MSITYSSCFYILKSKFDKDTYIQWINNFISIVNNFNLVIYTDENSVEYINTKNNPRIKVIIKPLELFYNYKYKDYWIKNHEKNIYLNTKTCWELNMLWSEKISFVKQTYYNKYFETEFYGWCDIGYFRNIEYDTHTSLLENWSNTNIIEKLPKNKIIYGLLQYSKEYIKNIMIYINNKNQKGLPIIPIPPQQVSISGGFFILNKNLIDLWFKTYDNTLKLYFENDYLVKDDQIILADCIFSDIKSFYLFKENSEKDPWFMFQRILQ